MPKGNNFYKIVYHQMFLSTEFPFPFFFLDLLGIVLSLLQHTMTGNSERDCRPQNLDL